MANTIKNRKPICNSSRLWRRKSSQTDIFNSVHLNHGIAASVLTEPVEKAAEFLKISGYQNVPPVPELFYVSVSDMAQFYGVNEKYLRGVLTRAGINSNSMQNDVIKSADFSGKLTRFGGKTGGVFDHYRFTGGVDQDNRWTNRYTFCDMENGCADKVVITFSCHGLVYSARVFLALSALMSYGRYLSDDAMASRIYKILKDSDYGKLAQERVTKEAERRREAEQVRREEAERRKAEREAELERRRVKDAERKAKEAAALEEIHAEEQREKEEREREAKEALESLKQEDKTLDAALPEDGFSALSETFVNLIADIVSRGINKGLSQINSTPPEPVPSVSLQMNEPAAVSDNSFNRDNRKRA